MWPTISDSAPFGRIDEDGQSADLVTLNEFPHRNPLTPVELHRVPLPVPTARRAAWRVTALVLILGSCRANSATAEQLHCLLWAISDRSCADLFLETWRSSDIGKTPLRKFYPPLEDALKISRAEGVITEKGRSRYILTARGKEYLKLLNSDPELLEEEKRFLAALRPISASGMWERLGVVKVSSRADSGAGA